jgi:hypothetical protein
MFHRLIVSTEVRSQTDIRVFIISSHRGSWASVGLSKVQVYHT